MLRNLQKQGSVIIADGAAISGALEIPVGFALGIIEVPTSWTAADLGFQLSTDGGTTFVDLYAGSGTTTSRFRLTGIPTGGASLQLVPGIFEIGLGMQVKLTSINTASNADANQTGAITLGIWVGRVN